MEPLKFTLNRTSPSRLGSLIFNDVPLKTPGCVLYTHAGSIPHLSLDNVQRVVKNPHPLLMPLQSTFDFRKSVESLGKGIASLCGFPETYPAVMTIHDPLDKIQTGFNDKHGICIWKNSGKVSLTPYLFSEIVNSYRPCAYQALTDGDTPKDCSKKRLNHSVKRSLDYLDICIRTKDEIKIKSDLLASLQGGYSEISRDFSTGLTLEREASEIAGFILDGFHLNGAETANLKFTEFSHLLLPILKRLPTDKPRFIFGCFSPDVILELLRSGVDCFDTSYACHSTDLGRALVFTFDDVQNKITGDDRQFFLELDKSTSYRDDMNVIKDDCECYTCQQKFSRAYINHLLVTRELLAYVLLQMHNLHHFLKFFEEIRSSLAVK